MLAKMALQLSHTVCEVAGFSGFLVTGVRFRFNKFPPSNMSTRYLGTPHNHGIFSAGEVKTCREGFGQVSGFGQCWHFPIWLTKNTQDDQSG